MEITIIFVILSIVIRLAEIHLQADKLCIHGSRENTNHSFCKNNLTNKPFECAVKFSIKLPYLLNTVTYSNAQKATQTTLIQLQILKFEG